MTTDSAVASVTPETISAGDISTSGNTPAAASFPTTPSPTQMKTASTTKNDDKTTTSSKNSDKTGIIILIVIIIAAVIFVLACLLARKKKRRYSVDLHSRPDEANIPLSTMEPELLVEAESEKGLKTFEGIETPPKEPEEPEAKPEVQTDQKDEADKSAADPSPEPAAPAPATSEDKPKVEAIEQSPAAPAGVSVEVKTDDEEPMSNKTSVESLKDTNENNSNNADLGQKRDTQFHSMLWEVSAEYPV
ncbi:uncharacterized protein si:dkey-27h10.2 isoform X2 [Cololabis saira]|nr:uncharacterized protein si:dkey-27h10.2 isoform X2 [Cololabis saira]